MIYLIIVTHWVSDFILQSDYVAKNKSKSNLILLQHVGIYGLPFLFLFGWKYAIINSIGHFIIDWFTSRASGILFRKGDIHNFFVIIGLDQALHLSCLVATIPLIGGGLI